MEREVWSVKREVWSVKCEVWSVKREAWSVKREARPSGWLSPPLGEDGRGLLIGFPKRY